jgi:hypothetical protein
VLANTRNPTPRIEFVTRTRLYPITFMDQTQRFCLLDQVETLRSPRKPETLEGLVSAAGFEPATHALKGHCSTT